MLNCSDHWFWSRDVKEPEASSFNSGFTVAGIRNSRQNMNTQGRAQFNEPVAADSSHIQATKSVTNFWNPNQIPTPSNIIDARLLCNSFLWSHGCVLRGSEPW